MALKLRKNTALTIMFQKFLLSVLLQLIFTTKLTILNNEEGLLKFFDKAFLSKKLDNEKETDLNRQKSQDFISPLSELVDFVRDFFKL